MCGRYYVDDETAEEIEKVIRLVDAKVHNRADLTMLQTGDIHSQERKNYAGIPSIVFDCTIVILGRQLAAKLIYYMSEGRWVLNFK